MKSEDIVTEIKKPKLLLYKTLLINIVLLFSFIFIGCSNSVDHHKGGTTNKNNQAENFTGSWDYEDGDITSFSLDLVQVGQSIQGQHCSVMEKGNRIDCSSKDDTSKSITGSISDNNVAIVKFTSYYGDGNGTAKLTLLSPNKLHWEIISENDPEYYLPKKCILKKKKNK